MVAGLALAEDVSARVIPFIQPARANSRILRLNSELIDQGFRQGFDVSVLNTVYNSKADVSIWQRNHDARVNAEVSQLLQADVELLLKIQNQPGLLMRALRIELQQALHRYAYQHLEADITRQVLQFARNSRANIIHFRLSKHGEPVAALPDGEFNIYQTTVYDGEKRQEGQLIKNTLDFRPGNTVAAGNGQDIAAKIQPIGKRFLFLRLGAQGTRDEFSAEEDAVLTAEHVLGDYVNSDFASLQDLPPTPKQQRIEQQFLVNLAKLDLLAEVARHPFAAKQQEQLQQILPKLLQQLVKPEVVRAISPATALQFSLKLTDLVATHPALASHPQLPQLVKATEQFHQIIVALAPAGMTLDKQTSVLATQSPRMGQLNAAILEGRLQTAQRILANYDLPQAKQRIEALLPEQASRFIKPEMLLAKSLAELQQVLKSAAAPTKGEVAKNTAFTSEKREFILAQLSEQLSQISASQQARRAELQRIVEAVEQGAISPAILAVINKAEPNLLRIAETASKLDQRQIGKPEYTAHKADELPKAEFSPAAVNHKDLAHIIEQIQTSSKVANDPVAQKLLDELQPRLLALPVETLSPALANALQTHLQAVVANNDVSNQPELLNPAILIRSVEYGSGSPTAEMSAIAESSKIVNHTSETPDIDKVEKGLVATHEIKAGQPTNANPLAPNDNAVAKQDEQAQLKEAVTIDNQVAAKVDIQKLNEIANQANQANLLTDAGKLGKLENLAIDLPTVTKPVLLEVAVRADFSAADLRRYAFDPCVSEATRQMAHALLIMREAEDKKLLEMNFVATAQKADTQLSEQLAQIAENQRIEEQRLIETRQKQELQVVLQKAVDNAAAAQVINQVTIINDLPKPIIVQHSNIIQQETQKVTESSNSNVYNAFKPANDDNRLILDPYVIPIIKVNVETQNKIQDGPVFSEIKPYKPSISDNRDVLRPPDHGPACKCKECEDKRQLTALTANQQLQPMLVIAQIQQGQYNPLVSDNRDVPRPPDHGPACKCKECQDKRETSISTNEQQQTKPIITSVQGTYNPLVSDKPDVPGPPDHGPACKCKECEDKHNSSASTTNQQPQPTPLIVLTQPSYTPLTPEPSAWSKAFTVPEHGPACVCKECNPDQDGEVSQGTNLNITTTPLNTQIPSNQNAKPVGGIIPPPPPAPDLP